MSRLSLIVKSKRNPHLLEGADGKPFPMLGDTAWELFHRLTLPEIDFYFATRKRQGFNMVWANLLPEFDGLRTPNRLGLLPLNNLDPAMPNDRYFEFVDEVLDLAESHGLFMGLLPAWGDKLSAPWGVGPRVFTLHNLDKARAYAEWLGQRYADRTNLIWVLGGDRPARLFGHDSDFPMRNAVEAGLARDTDWTPIWREMARALQRSGATQLMSYHPQGGTQSTSVFLHDEEWLDFNAIQSGHGGGHDVPVWESIERDYGLEPVKPTLDAEPNYEDSPVNPWPTWDPATGFFDAFDVRKQIYRSIFAGGCGAIYGNHCVWQFASELYEPVLKVRYHWREALGRPGAESIVHLRKLLSRVDFLGLMPDQSRIVGEPGQRGAHARAIRSESETLIYLPDGRAMELDLRWVGQRKCVVERFDPSSGLSEVVAAQPHPGAPTFCVPAALGGDCVIVVRAE